MNETAVARLAMVNIDCADLAGLAAFYGRVLGWPVTHSEAESPRASAYVDDLEGAVATCRELGASVPEFQPGGQQWQVLLDPDERPFCLCVTDGG